MKWSYGETLRLNSASGMGTDSSGIATNDVLEAYVNNNPRAAKVLDNLFPYMDLLQPVIGKNTFTAINLLLLLLKAVYK